MQYIVIIATSACMLTRAAHYVGYKPLVIDSFGDVDTRYFAEDFLQTASLATENIIPALDYFIKHYPVKFLVYGSGFEYFPESLVYLQTRLHVLGNSAETVFRLQNKADFFATLDTLNINYPKTVFTAPTAPDGWLIKPLRATGGTGIRRYLGNAPDEAGVYWQKLIYGQSYSALFVSDGRQLQIIGFNSQWSVEQNKDLFVFSGIINDTQLSTGHKTHIFDCLNKLVPCYGLTGLNSLDFIQQGEELLILEINSRPPASMHLYNDKLFIRHINACQGELSKMPEVKQVTTAYKIVFADTDVLIPENMNWSKCFLNIPETGAFIQTGQPICSMIVSKNDRQSLLLELQTLENQIKRYLSHATTKPE